MNKEINERNQFEEIEALESIFGKDWECVDQHSRVFNVNINDDEQTIVLQVVFTHEYPLDGPPIYRLNAPWLKREAKQYLANELEALYLQNIGQPIVFVWVERINEFLFKKEYANDAKETQDVKPNELDSSYEFDDEEYEKLVKSGELIEHQPVSNSEITSQEIPVIIHGMPMSDRKSTFQAHLAVVNDVSQVKLVLDKLVENRKIMNATHRIMAYRINHLNANNIKTTISNCDDDGETGAGSRMLFLMKTLDVENVMVVVSRWFGGIHLGPDRFKHINNCCREILEENGFIKKQSKNNKLKS